MADLPFLGCKISLISKCDIRYEGILYCVDAKESTIALSKVRSYGTETRGDPKNYVAPKNDVYDIIIFRASDVKDLRVDGPQPPGLSDPAIITAHQTYPGPTTSTSSFSNNINTNATSTTTNSSSNNMNNAPGVPTLNSNGSLPNSGPSTNQAQQQHHHHKHAQQAHPAHQQQHQKPLLPFMPTGSNGPHSNNKQRGPGADRRGGADRGEDRDMGERRGGGGGHDREMVKRRGGGEHGDRDMGGRRQGGGDEDRDMGGRRGDGRSNPRIPRSAYDNNRSHVISRYHNHNNNNNPNSHHRRGPNSRDENSKGDRPMYRRNPMQGGNRRARSGERTGAPRGHRKSAPLKFESEYDFDKANKLFLKLEGKFKAMKLKDGEEKDAESSGEGNNSKSPAGRSESGSCYDSEDQNHKDVDSKAESVSGDFYDRTKSFFDNISCEASERSQGKVNKPNWRKERQLNAETFGVSVNYRRGGHRGRPMNTLR